MFDIVIVNVPSTLTQVPFAAPALLKASIEHAGFTSKTLDFNIKFYQTVKDPQQLENYFATGVNSEVDSTAKELTDSWAKEILSYDPHYVGISVFTYQNRIAAKLLCESLKQQSSVKIIIGGQGLTDGGILGAQGFAKQLIADGLADYYIKSEGERAIVELLKGNFNYPGINSDTFEQIVDLDALPIPDYSDYELNLYPRRRLPVTASRGCVRACSFCDIHDHWKYQYRSGKAVAEEMIYLSNKHDIRDFFFTDSLVNGSLKEFREFCRALGDYNQTHDAITWTGQYIVRAEQHLSEEYWSNLLRAGGHKLSIGIETGSDTVREHMNKKFSNVDIDYTMRMLEKYNITCTFLMIIGYPTETEQDFQATLDMFNRYQHLAKDIIVEVSLGSTLGILPGTPLFYDAHDLNIELDKYENNWIAKDNPDLTLAERIRRVKIARDYIRSLGYYVNNYNDGMLDILETQLPIYEKRNKIKQMMQIKEVK